MQAVDKWMGKVHVNEASSRETIWKYSCFYFVKYFLFRNVLKYYFFIFKKLFLILMYQNDLKIQKILI
jgi:hypothetical protein